jgi:hypothetical protein
MGVDDESIDDDPELWWACQASIPFDGKSDLFLPRALRLKF